MNFTKTRKMRKYCLSAMLIAGIVFLKLFVAHVPAVPAQESYSKELLPGLEFSFRHLNLKSGEIAGYSHFRYLSMMKDGRKFVVEKNENTKPDGKVFTRKSLWFEASSGTPQHYEEEDLRKNFRITNTYAAGASAPGQIVRTRLDKAGKVLEFTTDLSREKAVPFEVVAFYLRKKLNTILQTENSTTDVPFSFTLFLPLLAIELEEKGLPRSMSMIRMLAEPQEEVRMKTPLGNMSARKILVYPQSRMLRTLLPKEKTHFEFTIASDSPYLLLQFEEGETRHVLTHLLLPK